MYWDYTCMNGLVQTLIINWLFFLRALSTDISYRLSQLYFIPYIEYKSVDKENSEAWTEMYEEKNLRLFWIFCTGYMKVNKRIGKCKPLNLAS